ncbi:MAG: 16S rRNA (cytosine(1402)-N(4))-methyltransferase, partial [Mesorhizobium sp.]
MMAGYGDDPHAVGGPARHIPVLLAEVLEALSPKTGEVVVDGTFGAGGYSKAILARGASVVAIDRDPDAIAAGRVLEQQSGG